MIAVLGVLKTQEGLRVKEEMLEWMRPVFDVLTVEQEAPGALYEYPALVDTDEPRLACPVMGDDSQTWFNAFVMNPSAARILRDTARPSADRYFFECVARGTAVKVVSTMEPVDATGAVQFVARYNF